MTKKHFVNQKLGKRGSRRQELAKAKLQFERRTRQQRGLKKFSKQHPTGSG